MNTTLRNTFRDPQPPPVRVSRTHAPAFWKEAHWSERILIIVSAAATVGVAYVSLVWLPNLI